MGHREPNERLLATIDRRTLLKYTVAGVASASFASLLVACADDDETPAAPGDETDDDVEPDVEDDDDTAEEPDDDGEPGASLVTIAQGTDVATFDPHEDTRSPHVFRNLFEHLVDRDPELELEPALAVSWENVDELTWEFEIRDGVTFHDGSELTAHDVAFSYEHVLDPDVGSRSYSWIAMIERVEAIDDMTVRMTTNEPYPPLLTTVNRIFIIPEARYQEAGPEGFAVDPIGTGPYQFVEWVRDDHFLLESFEDYWRGAPRVRQVQFRPIPEASTRVSALRAGEIDLGTLIPVSDVPTIEQDPNTEIRAVRSLRTIFVGMNTWNEPLNDFRVRQALNYGVDVDAIIEHLLNGHGYPLASVSGPSEFGHNPNLEPYPYDPDRARELLAEAGYPDGFDITLDTPSGQYLQDVEVSQAIAGQLAEIGVNVEVHAAEFNNYWDRWLAQEIRGLYFLGWGGATMDADGVMGGHLDSERRGLYYNSPESDEMIHTAMAEFDVEQRESIYHELMSFLHEQAPWIFLYSQEDIYGVASDLIWTPRSDENLLAYEMDRA